MHTLDYLVLGSELHREFLDLLLHFFELPLEGLDLIFELLDLASICCSLVVLLVELGPQELKLLGLTCLLLLELLDAPQLLSQFFLVAAPFCSSLLLRMLASLAAVSELPGAFSILSALTSSFSRRLI